MTEGARAERHTRFHGRVGSGETRCEAAGCEAPGEFRAPGEGSRPGADGPGGWRWLCLDHVRAFNGSYNYFTGMSPDEISDAQRPHAGWERETRAFATNGDPAPKWSDFADPLEAISGRFRRPAGRPRADGRLLSAAERKALAVLGLEVDADRRALRSRYAELVRRYHPDRNGGDRAHEAALQQVIAAYTRLKSARAFA